MKLVVSASLPPTPGGIPVDPDSMTTERAEFIFVMVTGSSGETVSIEITEENDSLHVYAEGNGDSRLTLIKGKGDIDNRKGDGAA